jgi:lipopolysaccharide export system protein LptA
MKFKIQNKIPGFLLITSTYFIINLSAFALSSDTRQPVQINAVRQALDMNANTVTFTDNVVIKQGTIEIQADKVIVIRSFEDPQHVVIDGTGNPVTFVQKQDNGKLVKGHAQTLRYEVKNEFIVLTGNAYLEQADSSIKGDRITYQVQQQKMEAFSDKGKYVTTIILPAQLQDNNKEHKNDKKKSP